MMSYAGEFSENSHNKCTKFEADHVVAFQILDGNHHFQHFFCPPEAWNWTNMAQNQIVSADSTNKCIHQIWSGLSDIFLSKMIQNHQFHPSSVFFNKINMLHLNISNIQYKRCADIRKCLYKNQSQSKSNHFKLTSEVNQHKWHPSFLNVTRVYKPLCYFLSIWFSEQNSHVFYQYGVINTYYFGGHDVVIKWKHFPHYWLFVRGIHRTPVNSLHKGQWRGALMFLLIFLPK